MSDSMGSPAREISTAWVCKSVVRPTMKAMAASSVEQSKRFGCWRLADYYHTVELGVKCLHFRNRTIGGSWQTASTSPKI